MANKIAVAVIHGMGSQGKKRQDLDTISFSSGLYYNLQQKLGHDFFQHVAWREIFWADILQDRQEDFIDDTLVAQGAGWMWARRFVMHNLGDAASYRKNKDHNDRIYDLIHERVFRTINRLQDLTDERTPLIILAHSLGGQIISNYIYDMGESRPVLPAPARFQSLSDFQKLKTMAAFTTFGCNIPVFAFSYEPPDIKPINYPGVNIAANKQIAPWWENYNSKSDALGMPLAGLSPKYTEMQTRGELQDHWVRVGGLFNSWNPFSHADYWTSRQFYTPVAETLRKAMEIGPVP